jgi:predicted aspartyl protease
MSPVRPDKRSPLAGLVLAGAVLLSLAGCAAGSQGGFASGQSCALDRQAAFPYESRANLMFVSLLIDDKPARLLVDTGADRSMVTENAARRLGLERDPKRLTRLEGVGGATTNWEVKTSTMVFGNAMVRNLPLTVGRFAQDEIAGLSVDGLLGVDILAAFDVEIDPVQHEVILYRARPCPDVLPPWPEPYMTVSSTGPARGRILVPITLDGVSDMAILDTGAQISSVSERLALSTGITQQQLDQDPGGRSRGASANSVITRAHRFHSLMIGTTMVSNPTLAVLPLPESKANALLGANYLRGRRLFLSFASRRFFLADPAAAAGP